MAQDLSDQKHTVRFPHPYEVVFDKATTLKAPVYLNGSLVAPDAATSTVTIFDNNNTKVVDGVSVTVTASIALVVVAANVFTEDDVGERIRVEWTLTGDGLSTTVLRPENDGIVAAREIFPCITDGDLIRPIRAVDPAAVNAITKATTFQDEIDEAWTTLVGWLIQDGTRPAYVMSPSSFRQTLIFLSLANVYGGILASRLNTAYAEEAVKFENRAVKAYNKVVILSDKDGDAIPDHPGRRGVAMGSVTLGGAPRRRTEI